MACDIGTTVFMLGQLLVEHLNKDSFLIILMCMCGYEHMNAGAKGVSDPVRAVARDGFDLPGMGTGKL